VTGTHTPAAESILTKTYGEVNDLAETDGSVLVVPLASVEQHGYHLPVGTDTLLGGAVAREGAERVAGDVPVLVTPPVWLGCSPEHVAFGGTLSVGLRALLDTLEDLVGSVRKAGFDAVVFVNGHGGNVPALEAAINTAGSRQDDLEVVGVTYFFLAGAVVESVRDSQPGGMFHGGELETSLMLHLHPDLVREEAVAATLADPPYEESADDLAGAGSVSAFRSFTYFSDSGAVGAPELASREKGERLYDAFVGDIAAVLTEVHETTDGCRKN